MTGRKRTKKFERLVVNAIKRLQDLQGSSAKEISDYLSQEYSVPNNTIQKQVRLALRRGVSYGILQQKSRLDFFSIFNSLDRKKILDNFLLISPMKKKIQITNYINFSIETPTHATEHSLSNELTKQELVKLLSLVLG